MACSRGMTSSAKAGRAQRRLRAIRRVADAIEKDPPREANEPPISHVVSVFDSWFRGAANFSPGGIAHKRSAIARETVVLETGSIHLRGRDVCASTDAHMPSTARGQGAPLRVLLVAAGACMPRESACLRCGPRLVGRDGDGASCSWRVEPISRPSSPRWGEGHGIASSLELRASNRTRSGAIGLSLSVAIAAIAWSQSRPCQIVLGAGGVTDAGSDRPAQRHRPGDD